MHEEQSTERFVVCKRRNVAAAYERFLGPSAGALEEPWHSRTWSGLRSGLKRMLLRRRRVVAALEPQPGESTA